MNIKHTIHIPELSGSYFSVRAATDSGLIVLFDAESVMLFHAETHKLVEIGKRKDNLNVLSSWTPDNPLLRYATN